MPLLDANDVGVAVERARAAQPAWSRLSYQERARFIVRAREVVLDQLEEIAATIEAAPLTEAQVRQALARAYRELAETKRHTAILVRRLLR